MTDKPSEPQIPSGSGEGQEPPPPFEPDEELITYLEKGREPKEEKRSTRRFLLRGLGPHP